MAGTVTIHGSDGYVMAPFGSAGTFLRGKRRDIRITGQSSDPNVPREIREGLVGLQVSCIFTYEEVSTVIGDLIPRGSILAYCQDIVDALRAVGKIRLAAELGVSCPDELDVYVFEPGTFELLE